MSAGPRRIGKYELQAQLGYGGMGEVWKAWDTQLERYVAIKLLRANRSKNADFVARFIREAQAIASLRHPNIVQVHDFQVTEPSVSEDSQAYMVMNYIEGPTLAQYIAQTSHLGKFPSSTSITYLFTALGHAVDYAHQHGMIHRDIKPANILLDCQDTSHHLAGEPILTDFGLVKLLREAGDTLIGQVLGTPFYMSPEQARGQVGNERSDIYSLGVILYEVCTGVRPFRGNMPASILAQHITTKPTPPDQINPNLPPAVSEVILCCLEKDPAARFSDALSLTTALSAAFRGAPLFLPPQPRSVSLTTEDASPASLSISEYVAVQQAPRPAPLTPVFTPTGQYAARMTPGLPSAEATQLPGLPSLKKQRRVLPIVLSIMLLFMLVAGSTGTYYALIHNSTGSIPSADFSVGAVAFESSDIYSAGNNRGVEDELHVSLHDMAPPAVGKDYYAWLLSDTDVHPTQFLLLRKLPVSSSNVEMVYQYDAQHTSLLAHYSRFLITVEDASRVPIAPSSQASDWLYYAELPQRSTDDVSSSTALEHLRALLSGNVADPSTWAIGGLAPRFLKSTQAVQALANSTRQNWSSRDVSALRQQIVSILYYLDGTSSVQRDVPPSQDRHTQIDETLAQMSLIDIVQGQSESYISNMNNQLQGLQESPGISLTMSKLTQQALDALPDTQGWLQQMRSNAQSLLAMTDTDLLQPHARDILDDMVTEAQNAYNGQIGSSANSPQNGAVFIYDTIQRLAIFDVKPCTGTSSEWHCTSASP